MVPGKPPLTWEGRYDHALAQMADQPKRFYFLASAAKAAFELGKIEEAGQHARELLEAAPHFERDFNYGNAIHDGHMVLGRIALRKGNAETAGHELLEAGKTPGSPQLNSFGPNMALARDLLAAGQRGVVLEYFKLCSAFWEMERGRLAEWTADADAGRLPAFGANLVY